MLTIMKTFLDLVQMLKFLATKGQMELDESSSDVVPENGWEVSPESNNIDHNSHHIVPYMQVSLKNVEVLSARACASRRKP